MTTIHPTALVSPKAVLGTDVCIGPYCIIEEGTVIGDRCRLASQVVVKRGTTLGCDNKIFEGTVLGGAPQHIAAGDDHGTVRIGNGNTIREFATIHLALKPGTETVLGDGNFLMVSAHIGHDCVVGNRTIIGNNSMLGGHVTVGDRAYISAAVAVHQFGRVGGYAMVGGQAHLTSDVPPYVTVDGLSSMVVGLNTIGLRRNGFTPEQIQQLKAAYRIIYRSGLRWDEVIEQLRETFTEGPACEFARFLAGGKRSFIHERRAPRGATLKIVQSDGREKAATAETAEPADDISAA